MSSLKRQDGMGKTKLVLSPIQLRLANQQRLIAFGRMLGVIIKVEGLRSYVELEFIQTMMIPIHALHCLV